MTNARGMNHKIFIDSQMFIRNMEERVHVKEDSPLKKRVRENLIFSHS